MSEAASPNAGSVGAGFPGPATQSEVLVPVFSTPSSEAVLPAGAICAQSCPVAPLRGQALASAPRGERASEGGLLAWLFTDTSERKGYLGSLSNRIVEVLGR